MFRFRGEACLFDAADIGGNIFEIGLDGGDRRAGAAVSMRFRQISFGELLALCLGNQFLILGPGEIELSALHKARRFGAFEENEILELPDRIKSDEMELFPQPIEFALMRFVEHQIIKRRVVANISCHQMKAGAEQPPFALLVLFQKDETAFGEVEGIRKDRTKALKRLFVTGNAKISR